MPQIVQTCCNERLAVPPFIRTFKHEKRKQAKFWIHPKRPRNHESDMRPLSSSKLTGILSS
ncbi:hypothetical protein DERF_000830 [Dermatophagoides farinae]|uniref:Uncharacterized protein n=1 Tax=Dermatophagoides farinae TaxID=6954 RepID=A0A922I9N6_DERFA|nr:hypothetical protein DERF_000830 [Dermatophagoides farinae]